MKKTVDLAGISRRGFLKGSACAALLAWGGGVPAMGNQLAAEEKTGTEKRLGIALVGLGEYAEEQLAPALKETGNCYLAGIVTGTPEKAERFKKRYNLKDENIFDYANFNRIRERTEIDIVYVVLPTGMHAEYTIRAAQAGKHVICEKPMAIGEGQCREMLEACQKAGRTLSIGYRLHFDPFNLEMMRIGRDKPFGAITQIRAKNGGQLFDRNAWRVKKELSGGGPLTDLGVYCIQGSCYTKNMEPLSVRAKFGPVTRPDVFTSVEESISWEMEFPDGTVAECETSYAKSMNLLRAEAQQGFAELSPAYEYGGLKGTTSSGPMKFTPVNQQAKQMDGIAAAILEGKRSRVPGEMGLRDVRIIDAVYRAAEAGKEVTL